MEQIDLSILALTIAKEIYCNNKEDAYNYIEFFDLIIDNLKFLLSGSKKDRK